jgi:hypothetical protein
MGEGAAVKGTTFEGFMAKHPSEGSDRRHAVIKTCKVSPCSIADAGGKEKFLATDLFFWRQICYWWCKVTG